MAVKQDYYKVLGIDRNADDKTIKKAYRKMAKKYHPDMNPGDAAAEQKFKEITEAYNVLSDSEKKKLYDQFGHAAFEEGFSPGDGESYDGPYGTHREYHFTGDASDIFGDIFGDLFNDGHFSGHGSFGGLVATMVLGKVVELAVAAALMRTDILENMVDFREHIFTAQEVVSRSLVMI